MGSGAPERLWPNDADAIAEAAREIQNLGFGALWIGGSPADDLKLPEAVLAATSTLVVGTSIVDIWTSSGPRSAASHARIRNRFPERFYLGVGSGHAPTAESRGQSYTRPLSRLRELLTGSLAEVPAQERMIAALGPKTLETAGELTAGALPDLTPPAHTAEARRILARRGHKSSRSRKYSSAPTVLRPAGAAARRCGPTWLCRTIPRQLIKYGLDESDLAGNGSDRFIDSAVVWGDADRVRAGVDADLTAGADHVAVQVLTEAGAPAALPRAQWRELAEVARTCLVVIGSEPRFPERRPLGTPRRPACLASRRATVRPMSMIGWLTVVSGRSPTKPPKEPGCSQPLNVVDAGACGTAMALSARCPRQMFASDHGAVSSMIVQFVGSMCTHWGVSRDGSRWC